MHLMNKITHLVRAKTFKLTIVIMLAIYLYKLGGGDENFPSRDGGVGGSIDLESIGKGGDVDKYILKMLLNSKLSGDKLIRSLELKKRSSAAESEANDDGENPTNKLKAAFQKFAKAVDNVKKIPTLATTNKLLPETKDENALKKYQTQQQEQMKNDQEEIHGFKSKTDAAALPDFISARTNNDREHHSPPSEEFNIKYDEIEATESDNKYPNAKQILNLLERKSQTPDTLTPLAESKMNTENKNEQENENTRKRILPGRKSTTKWKVVSSSQRSISQTPSSSKNTKSTPKERKVIKRKAESSQHDGDNRSTNNPSSRERNVVQFVQHKLKTNFTSKAELVEYVAEMNRINNKPVFAYLNKRWNSGGNADYYKRVITTERPAGRHLCHNWTYNAADYTLVYEPNKWYQNETCPLPKNETIKKIVLPNKDVVWKGCTRKTASCSESPFFDEEKGFRRNVPPCCRHHLLEMLGNIDKELTLRNITYILTDGAVIGWYRNQKLVPYDADLDMYIDGAYFKTRVWDEVFGNLTTKYGYKYTKAEDFKFKLEYSAINGLTVDIWPYFNIKLRTQYGEVKPGEWLTFVYHSRTTAMRVNEFFPPKRTTIDGVPCNVPRDTVKYLNENYGPTPDRWLTELTCKQKRLYNCIS